jgi:hypothetical protein
VSFYVERPTDNFIVAQVSSDLSSWMNEAFRYEGYWLGGDELTDTMVTLVNILGGRHTEMGMWGSLPGKLVNIYAFNREWLLNPKFVKALGNDPMANINAELGYEQTYYKRPANIRKGIDTMRALVDEASHLKVGEIGMANGVGFERVLPPKWPVGLKRFIGFEDDTAKNHQRQMRSAISALCSYRKISFKLGERLVTGKV